MKKKGSIVGTRNVSFPKKRRKKLFLIDDCGEKKACHTFSFSSSLARRMKNTIAEWTLSVSEYSADQCTAEYLLSISEHLFLERWRAGHNSFFLLLFAADLLRRLADVGNGFSDTSKDDESSSENWRRLLISRPCLVLHFHPSLPFSILAEIPVERQDGPQFRVYGGNLAEFRNSISSGWRKEIWRQTLRRRHPHPNCYFMSPNHFFPELDDPQLSFSPRHC